MEIINKIKRRLPATKQKVECVEAKIDNATQEIEKLSKTLCGINEQLESISERMHFLEKKQTDTLLPVSDNVKKIRDEVHNSFVAVKGVRDEVHNSFTTVQGIRDEVHNSFQSVQDIRKEVHDNNKYLKSQAGKQQQLDETIHMVKNVVENGNQGVCKRNHTPQLIVSLTSYPKRIASTAVALERIFAQTLKPDRIILWLSEENFPSKEAELPLPLLDLKQRGLEIAWCQGDIKSYKKLIPALEKYPEDIIITLDDDLFYELDLVEKLYASYQKHPNAISAMRTHKINFEENGQVSLYAQWSKDCSEYIGEPRRELFATTGAGTLFPPKVLDSCITNAEDFLTLAPTADDMWVKCMAELAGTPVVLVRENKPLRYIDGTQEETLWGTNMSQNDIQLKNIMEKYQITMGENH